MSWFGGPLYFSIFGEPAGFARSELLWLAVPTVLLSAFAIFRALNREHRVHTLLLDRHAKSLVPGLNPKRPVLRASLAGTGLLFWVIALGQPQCGSHSEVVKSQGIDLVVALDLSASMSAQDVKPSRLERAKFELNALLDELKGDRVGIVIFAGDAFIQCPLTSDYSAAKLFLGAARVSEMPQGGTNIGAALETSKEVLDGADRGAADRVIVLLSDGEDLAGNDSKILSTLKEANIRVYTVGIGSDTGAPIPLADKDGNLVGYKKDESGRTVMTRLDRAGLEKIARATGGEFFYRPNSVAIPGVVSRIDKLHHSEGEAKVTVRYEERFVAFAVKGTLLMFLSALFWPTNRTRVAAT